MELIGIVILLIYPNLKVLSIDIFHTTSAVKSFVVDKMMNSPSDFENLPFDYVERESLEKKILSIGDRLVDGSYYIVYGPKGVGKSAVVNHVLCNQKRGC